MPKKSLVEQVFVLPDDSDITTFGKDEVLPSLPLPSLNHTINRYIESLKPFMKDATEFSEAIRVAREFEKGEGKVLHEKLAQRAAGQRNWLEQWWLNGAYLSLREPLIPFYSMTGSTPLEDLNWKIRDYHVIKHAALYTHQLVNFWLLMRSDRMIPTQGNDKKVFFSMQQFRRLFNCVRIPAEHTDELVTHFKTAKEGTCASHVMVLCNGRIFRIEALDADGKAITPAEWERQLDFVSKRCQEAEGPGIGLLTCDKRPVWAKNRTYLQDLSLQNRSMLHDIETAMFMIVLDKDRPEDDSGASYFSLCGDFSNRWTDKSLCVIFYQSGAIGGLCDHTAFDGMISVAALYYVYLALLEHKEEKYATHKIRYVPEPVEINFQIDAFIESELQRAKEELAPNKSLVVIVCEKFKGYGKDFIQQHKLHPDSFVQMALQLAYYRVHGKPAPTYETATTRAFYNGRTETVRSCTEEAIEWVTAMLSKDASNADKKALLERAVLKHDKLMNEARANAGCDRHLFGLYCTALEEGLPIPSLYSHPAYLKSGGGGNYVLSTSLVGYTPIGGGVSPMCLNGYGCFYNITPTSW
ncbi:peroxisomal carnitine O-octanoyltransferase isoform X2 [Anabrus simplex]|uniref:peroxisomal carnitine O-octanoyltransferase isoform X2 n=1 Tax=Anabrus simplex TaxID=316456 RepID=UPI0035A33D9C